MKHKKKDENLEENIKRHMNVLFEDMDSKFKVFGEELRGLSQKTDLLAEDMDAVKSNIVDMKGDIVVIKSDIVDIKSDIVDIKSELKIMNKKLDNKPDKHITDNHEKRLVKLEKVLAV